MSELDRLCELLDEQGLEWREHEAPATDCIAFCDGSGWHDCWESVDGEVNVTFSITPEQAIAATLGRGVLSASQVSNAVYAHSIHADCADADWQAIADELNATLGRGTCHITDSGPWGHPYVCSACGASFDPDVRGGEFNFCPNCGARIEVWTHEHD